MAETKINVLLIEDNPDDVLLIEEMLKEGGRDRFSFAVFHADRLSEGIAKAKQPGIDVILSDMGLPDSEGLHTFRALFTRFEALPIIVLLDLSDEQIGMQSLKEGAQDYLVKGEISGKMLVRSLAFALERKRILHELQVHQLELSMQNEELRRTQVELDVARARYFDLYDLAPVGYVAINDKGLIVEANFTAATLLGVARETLVRQPISLFILQEDKDIYYLRRQQLLETGEPQGFDLRMMRKDGMVFWAHLEATAAQDTDSTPVFRAVLSDITERKRMEEVQLFLAQTSRGTADEPFFFLLARYLAQSLGMDFVCIDRLEGDGLTARTVAVWCDGHFEDNVTYALKDTPCGEVVGKMVCCFPASVCRFFPRDQVLQDLQAESYIGVTLFSHTGKPIGLIAVIGRQPLANRSQAEAALKMVAVRAAGELERLQAEELLGQVAANIPGAIYQFIHRLDGSVEIPFMSEGAAMLFERPTEELRDSSRLFDDVHPDDLEGIWASIQESANSMSQWTHEFRIIGKNKETKWLRSSSNPIPLTDGSICWNGAILDITERKRAEMALKESEEQLRNLFHNAPVGIFHSVWEGRLLTANPALARMLGYSSPEELISATTDMATQIYLDPSMRARIMAQLKESEGWVHYDEVIWRRKDGGHIIVDMTGRKVMTATGTTSYLEGFIQDITERKRMEAALTQRMIALTRPLDQTDGITFAELFDPVVMQRIQDEFAAATGVASIITQPDGTPLTRPSNFCRLCRDVIRGTELGLRNCYHSDAILGRYHPDGPLIQQCLSGGLWDAGASITVGDRHIANWLIGQVRDETQSEEQMSAYARSIGSDERVVIEAFHEVPAMSRARFQQVAQALFTLANQLSATAYQNIQQARFISDRRQAEAALRASEERFRNYFELPLIGIAMTSLKKGWLEINDRLCQILGYSREELMRMTWAEMTHPEDLPMELEQFSRVESGEIEGYSMEKRFLRKDGKTIYTDLSVSCLRQPDGGIDYFVALIQDITARKVLEDQLRQAQKMDMVGRLAGGVAHDFNNMLGVILGHSELAMAQVDPAQPLHEDLEEIHQAASRSADLTRQLLTFARRQTVAPQLIDVNKTVAGMLKMLQRLIGENIILDWQPGMNLWAVNVDPSQVDQILANLCVNARDAISGVGKIAIGTENSTLDEAYCANHAGFIPGEYVRLSVSDNGCGMDRETLGHIFEPFFTTKDVGEGTGLGLATVYGAVKQNNGFINAYSELGYGTTFSIYLPRHVTKVEPLQSEGTTPTAVNGRESILLVEDEPSILKLTKTLLERQGYNVLAVSTPGDAIRLAREHSGEIHLLMTDVIMPEMNGRDLARSLQFVYPSIRCLFMSGYTADIIASQGVLDRGVHFIQKPFSLRDLAAKVREVLDGELEESP